jgi:pimeloyl-ACP methyl ester carboxylesterase
VDWQQRTVSSGDVQVAAFEAGDPSAPTLLMLHGWPDTHRLWDRVAGLLAEDLHVVAPDLRGMGGSSDPGAVDRFGMEHLVGDLRAVLDAVSPDRPAHLLGHDWGSMIGWAAVGDAVTAGRIASFTSISGPGLDHVGRWARDELARRTPRGLGRVMAQGLSSSYIAFFLSPLAPRVLRTVATRERWARFLSQAERVQVTPDDLAPTLVDDMVSGLRLYKANIGLRGDTPEPRRTAVPVLQLVAKRDAAVRDAALRSSDAYAERLERLELTSGHWAPLSRPGEVAEATLRFVRSVEGGPTGPAPA